MMKIYWNVSNAIQLHLSVKVEIKALVYSFKIFASIFLADGYHPDRQNCRIYHICTGGVDTAAVCGDGTAWDPVKKTCNWENTVACVKGLRKWDEITDSRGGKINRLTNQGL